MSSTTGPPALTSRSVLRGLVVLRWATWIWSVGVVVVGAERVARPWLAVVLLAAALVVTIIGTWTAASATRSPPRWFIAAELAVGFALLALEGFVFEAGQAFAGRQGLAGGWPVVGVIGAGLTMGPWVGAPAGALVGLGRVVGSWANGVRGVDGDQAASLVATVAFYALYGGVSGWVGNLLRRAEDEVATTRARDEMATALHDGVLQTLALVERRTATSDPLLARLARDTDRDLRLFLYGPVLAVGGRRPFVATVREAASRAARVHDLDVTFSIVEGDSTVDDAVALDDARVAAVAGAVGEAVTNVGKHASATRVVVFVETQEDGTVFVSVRDDGVGFDTGQVDRGQGLTRSVAGRLAEVGGRAEVASTPGTGTEVRLWLAR